MQFVEGVVVSVVGSHIAWASRLLASRSDKIKRKNLVTSPLRARCALSGRVASAHRSNGRDDGDVLQLSAR